MQKLAPWISTLSLVLATLAFVPGATAADAFVPGTRVTLRAPEGFSPSGRFPGFEHRELGASIMVTELPVPFAELRKGMTSEGLASRGMKLLASEEIGAGNSKADLLHASQQAQGIEFLKWMLVTGNEKTSVMVVGTVPRTAFAELGPKLRTAVQSASFHPEAAIDLLQGMPFAVTPSGRLKIAGRVGNMLMLTKTGAPGAAAPGDPLYVVGNSFSEITVSELRTFSEDRLRKTARTSNVRKLDGRETTVDGLPAYELIAEADDARSGRPLRLYQVIARDRQGYLIIQGLVALDGAAEYVAEFRRLTDSLKRRSIAEAAPPK